jgi:dihydroorotase
MSSILVKNALIVNEGKSVKEDLLIKDDIIFKIGDLSDTDIPSNTYVIDASGKVLMPGIIDDQVHFREPGLTHKADIFSESRAAAAGGVTSFMDMPNTDPQTTTLDLLNEKYSLGSEKSLINYAFYPGATNDNIDELAKMNPSEIPGIKLFMGSSTGNMLVDNEESLQRIFSFATNLPLCVHCEDEREIRKNSLQYKSKYGEDVPIKMHPLIRSREACLLSSSHAVELARKSGTRLHILHLSTADELKLFDNNVPLQQKKITAEVCVHHLWFDDTYYDVLGTKMKWNPAIKTKYDRDALRDGINKGLIDVVATDHAPHTIAEKKNKYFQCPSGGPLIQHSLVIMLELWHRKIFTLEKIAEMMCHNPAILFNIKQRGFIREGFKADLTIIDPFDPWTIAKENILYKCGWSPFEGTTFRSKVVTTIVNGNIIYNDGYINEDYRGERLYFNR